MAGWKPTRRRPSPAAERGVKKVKMATTESVACIHEITCARLEKPAESARTRGEAGLNLSELWRTRRPTKKSESVPARRVSARACMRATMGRLCYAQIFAKRAIVARIHALAETRRAGTDSDFFVGRRVRQSSDK